MLRVASAAKEDVGLAAVEEGRPEVVLRRAVAVAVAPVVGSAARQGVGHPELSARSDGIGLARRAVEVEQVFRPRVRIGHVGRLQDRVARVDPHVADLGGRAVGMMDHHVVSTAHEHLRAPVAVPVVADGIILLVRTGDHVGPQVDPPQPLALQRVALYVVVGRVVAHRRTVRAVVALDDELAAAVTRHVGQGDVVDVVVGRDVSAAARVDLAHGELNVLLAEPLDGLRLRLLHAAHDGRHLIRRTAAARRVGEARRAEGLVVHLHAVAIKVVLRVIILLAEDAPADERTRARGHCHESAVDEVGGALGAEVDDGGEQDCSSQ